MRLFIIFILATCMILLPIVAQNDQQIILQIETIDDDNFPSVQVEVSVTDTNNQPVPELGIDQFTLLEDGIETAISDVQISDLGISVVLVMDTSESMFALPAAQEAAQAFVDTLTSDDSVALIDFDTNIVTIQSLTTDHDLIRAGIENELGQGGRTALYDGALAAVQEAAHVTTGRRIVILLADGNESGDSISGRSAALEQAQELGIPIYTVGLGANFDRSYLENLAVLTGGQYFNASSGSELTELYVNLAATLRQAYLLTFESEVAGDGANHELAVRVASGDATAEDAATFLSAEIPPEISLPDFPDQSVAEAITITPTISVQGRTFTVAWDLDGESLADTPTDPPYEIELDPDELAPGSHLLIVTVTDGAGQRSSAEWTFDITGEAPKVTLQGVPGETAVEPFVLEAAIETRSEDTEVIWEVNGEEVSGEADDPSTLAFVPSEMMPGTYTVAIIVTDDFGLSTIAEAAFEIAALPPVVTISGLEGGAELADEEVTVTLDITSQTVIEEVSFTLNNEAPMVNTDTPFSFEFAPLELSVGEHTLTIMARNASDTPFESTLAFTTTIAPPAVSLIRVPERAANDSFTISAEIDAASDNSEIKWRVDGQQVQTDPDEPESLAFDPSIMQPGEYTVFVTVTDSYGLSSSAEATFEIAALAPVVTVQGLETGTELGDQSVTVRVDITSQTEVTEVTFELDEQEAVIQSVAPYSFEVDPIKLAGQDKHRLTITVENDAGLRRGTVLNFTTTIAAPIITLNDVPDSAISEAVTIQAIIEASADTEIVWRLDGEEIRGQIDDPASILLDPTSLQPGAYTLSIMVTDIHGLSTTEETSIEIAALAPVMTISGLDDGAELAAETVTVRLALESQTNITQVSFQINEGDPTILRVPPFSFEIDPLELAGLETSDHQLTISAENTAGVREEAVLTFKTTIQPPQLFFNIMPQGVISELFTLDMEVDAASDVEVDWRLDGEALEPRIVGNIFSYEFDPLAMQPGEHILSIRVTDEYGLSAQLEDVTLEIEAILPSMEVIGLADGAVLEDAAVVTLDILSQTTIATVSYQLDDNEAIEVVGPPYRAFSIEPEVAGVGAHTLVIVASNAAGEATQSINFEIDESAIPPPDLSPVILIVGAIIAVLVLLVLIRVMTSRSGGGDVPGSGKVKLEYEDIMTEKQVSYKIAEMQTTIGRSPGNNLVLVDPQRRISREHAVIEVVGTTWKVVDTKSSHGVFVNSVKIDGDQRIFDGDKIKIGSIELTFIAPGFEKREEDMQATMMGTLAPDLAVDRRTLAKPEEEEEDPEAAVETKAAIPRVTMAKADPTEPSDKTLPDRRRMTLDKALEEGDEDTEISSPTPTGDHWTADDSRQTFIPEDTDDE